jgi:hypothetical protein
MPKLSLDSAVVKAAFCPTDQNRLDLYDTAITGFTLEVRPSGVKPTTYVTVINTANKSNFA